MFNKNTKMFLLLTIIFFAMIGLSAATAANTDNDTTETPLIAEDTTTQTDYSDDNSITTDVSNNAEITKNTRINVKGEGESTEDSTPTTYTINNENWTEYFDENSIIKSTVSPNSQLQFEGTFTDKDMIINVPVTITTADTQAILENCTFLVIADDVNITKLEMTGTDLEYALITVEDSSNVKIESNNLTLTNTADKVETRSILVDGGSDNIIKNNIITTVGPEDNIKYDADDSISMIYTTSIKANSDRLIIDGNKITTKKNDLDAESVGTLIGVYVYGDDNDNMLNDVKIVNNEIFTEGTVYDYGLKVYYLDESLIENNTVTCKGDNFASAIHVFATTDSDVNDNIAKAYANMGYGIVLEGFFTFDMEEFEIIYAVPENVYVTNNIVIVESKYAWGIETFGGSYNFIGDNNININSDLGIGIGLTDEGTIVEYNDIIVNSEMSGSSIASYDFIDPYTTGIKIAGNSIKNTDDNTIIANYVVVNAPNNEIPAVNITRGENTVIKNYLVSPSGEGDDAVNDAISQSTIENNAPGTVITDETYTYFFDEYNMLIEDYNNTDLTLSGDFIENTEFLFDGVNVTVTSDGTGKIYDGLFWTGNNATVVFNGLVFDNTMDAFVLESDGNIINNTIIKINSADSIHAIYVYGAGNIIANTVLNITAPSADVEYNPDFSTKSPAPAAIVISSDDNLIDNATVYFDGSTSTGFFPTVDGIYVVSEKTPVSNNVIKDTTVRVIGNNYVYGINIGNAKDTTIENINIDVASLYYADAIQLFDANTISITGTVNAYAESEAYGVYSTAMGYGFSQNIDLTGLDVNVEAAKATGTLIEGAKDVLISDATYDINGETSTAIMGHVDFMGNVPENIIIENIEAYVQSTLESDAIYFGQSKDITVMDSNITSNMASFLTFNNVTDVKLFDDVIINSTISTILNTNITADKLSIINAMDAFLLESEGNIINNTIINIESEEAIHAIYVYEAGNTITNTIINVVAPSADVEYNPDYSTKSPAPAAIVISSDNNIIDNVDVFFDGRTSTGFFPTVDGIYIVSESVPVVNNTIKDSDVTVLGNNYVYGINIGNAKDTTIENLNVNVDSLYYADAIQLFDADTISITGTVNAYAESEAYGVYSTAMGYGFSQNIDLTGLDVNVEAAKATGTLIEGASNVMIADATYDITGDEATAVKSYVDFMGNIPTNITITGLDVTIDTTGDANILYFGKSSDVSITENNIESTGGSQINFNATPNARVTDNYILVGQMLETGIFGNYAVTTTEEDTIVENNTPTSKLIDDLNDKINELEEQLAELTKAKETTITIDPLEEVQYGDEITISGTLVNEDSLALSNQNITIKFNDEETTVTTRNGEFKYTTVANIVGENTVAATYVGNDKYTESEATYTFTVDKANAYIELNDLEAVKKGDVIAIGGVLYDHNNNTLANKVVRLLVNNGRKTVKTNDMGEFSFDYTTTKVGTIPLTATFEETDLYKEFTVETTFEVEALSTNITFDDMSQFVKGNQATISGILTDEKGNAIANAQVKLTINGSPKTLKTDSEGRFTHTYIFGQVGENTITASYAGSSSYTQTDAQITVDVVKTQATITLAPIEDVTVGSTVNISGTLVYADGNPIANAQVRITVNGSPKTLRTDENGAFTHVFTMYEAGITNITASFNGNTYYDVANTTTTVKVIKAE